MRVVAMIQRCCRLRGELGSLYHGRWVSVVTRACMYWVACFLHTVEPRGVTSTTAIVSHAAYYRITPHNVVNACVLT